MKRTDLFLGSGSTLTRYGIDAEALTLEAQATLDLGGNVQHLWPHASLPLAYAVSTDWLSRHQRGTNHFLNVIAIDPRTGELARRGEPVRLVDHPVDLCTDRLSRHLLVAHNVEPDLHVYRLNEDGSIGARVPQGASLDWGHFPHQINVSPDDGMAVLVARGNPGHDGPHHTARQTDPGSLRVFDYDGASGRLSNESIVAPGGGWHFGPRNMVFHPGGPWVYVSLETQNKLVMFRREGNRLQPEPVCERDILRNPGHISTQQAASTLQLHPSGRFLYCVNRGYTPVDYQGKKALIGTDNSFAVYAIDPATGEPKLIQHIDSNGIFTRTFSIDPGGRMLVACNAQSHWVKDEGREDLRWVQANLAVFAIQPDGRLAFVRQYELPKDVWLWAGMVSR